VLAGLVRRNVGMGDADKAPWTSYDETRDVARNWRVFSSELNGQPDIRPYRQFPLEADPPAHTKYRAILAPFFERRRIEALAWILGAEI
jgi:cytochrome P450